MTLQVGCYLGSCFFHLGRVWHRHVMIQGLGHCTYQKHQRTRNHGPCDVMPRFIMCWPASVSQRDTSRSRAPQLAESCRQAQAERSLKSFRYYSLFTVAATVAKWFKLTRNRECRSWSLLSGAQDLGLLNSGLLLAVINGFWCKPLLSRTFLLVHKGDNSMLSVLAQRGKRRN